MSKIAILGAMAISLTAVEMVEANEWHLTPCRTSSPKMPTPGKRRKYRKRK